MGKYNSSIYRVRPLMKILEKDYQSFLTFLSLVELGPFSMPHTCRYDGEHCTEMQLKPTRKHLSALIDHMAVKEHTKATVTGEDRLHLFYGNEAQRQSARIKAQNALAAGYDTLNASSRPWFLFEGFTNPDIFIEGADYVIVCEGKWTESHITTTTTHLSGEGEFRSQMVRHIQGALNYSHKKVYAFYIVDAGCGYIPDLTRDSFSKQLAQETIALTDAEKAAILDAYCGYTTWQEIQAALPQVVFPEKHEIIQLDL